MADEISNKVLLEHIQAMKNNLEEMKNNLDEKIERLEKQMKKGFTDVHEELAEARQHREALQEDLEATILKQYAHENKLASLSR